MGIKPLKASTLDRLTSGLQVKRLQYRTAFPVMNPSHGTPGFGEVCMHFNVPSSLKYFTKKLSQFELISGIYGTIHHISLANYPLLFPKWIAFSIRVGKSGCRQSCTFLVCMREHTVQREAACTWVTVVLNKGLYSPSMLWRLGWEMLLVLSWR